MKIPGLFRRLFAKKAVSAPVYRMGEQVARVRPAFGDDFNAFLYRPGIEGIIRGQLLPLLHAPPAYNGFLDLDHWDEKHPFNFPGPFYTGQSDSCGTGDVEAPSNVMYDADCFEYVFKQPSSFEELLCLIDAAAVEVFDCYACNGNSYWTYSLCREWWRGKHELIAQLSAPEVRKMNDGREQLYIDYLNTGAEADLRRYCFFLENGFYPCSDGVLLPNV